MPPSDWLTDPPGWLKRTQRLFPHPLFAGVVSLMFSLLAFIFFLGSLSGVWQLVVVCLLFAWCAFATASAAVTQIRSRRAAAAERNKPKFVYFDSTEEFPSSGESNSEPGKNYERHTEAKSHAPTMTIVILLVGSYSFLLTIGFNVGRIFGKQPVPDQGLKYYVTLAICILSSSFMRFRGAAIMREYFVTHRNQPIHLTTGQCFVVLGIALSFSAYMMWILP